jgi:WD40 repeat protein
MNTPMMRYAVLLALLLASSKSDAQEAVDYGAQIAPLLTRNCSACHNTKKPEGGLILESYASLMKGGDSGEAIVPAMIEKGELLARIVATDDSAMPPANNAVGAKKLTDAEVALVKAWVAAGAPAPKAATTTAMNWRDITGTLKPIYASDVSPDGTYLAYGVGNVLALAASPFGATTPKIDYLLDPNLKLADGKPVPATHIDLIQSIAFSPDSQRLATGGFKTVKIWKRETGFSPLATTMPAGAKIVATDMSGSRLAVASPEHSLVLVDANTLQPITTLRGHTDRIEAAAFTPNTQTIFSCDATGRLLRWDLPTELPAELAYIESAPAPNVMLVSKEAKDIRVMASVSVGSVVLLRQDNKVTALQQAAQSAEAGAPPAAYVPVPAFDRFADLKTIATAKPGETLQYLLAQNSGVIEVVKPDTAETVIRFEQGAPLATIALTRDGTKVSAAGTSGPTKFWNLVDGKTLATLQTDYDQVRTLEVAQRSVARQKSLVDLLTASVPELKKEAEKEVEARKKVEEARTKAVEAIAAKVQEVEAAQAQVTMTVAAIEESRKAIEELNKKMLALATEKEAKDKLVVEADKKKQDAEAELTKHDQALATATASVDRANSLIPQQEMLVTAETAILTTAQQGLETLQKSTLPVTSALSFDATGTTIVAAGSDNSLNLFDAASGKAIAKLAQSPVAIHSLLISADRKIVAGDGNQWFSWNLGLPWSLERTLGSPLVNDSASNLFSDRITALDFSPDGKSLAIGSGPPSRFGDIKIIAVATGEIQRDLGEAHSDTVLGLRFSPDGRQLATCGADKLCRLYQLDSGQVVRSFEGHTHHVLGVAWQNNGQALATASADNSVKTWNVASGERKQSIGGFTKEVTGIEFVGLTDQVVTSSVDGQARLHNASNAQQVRAFSGANTALYTVSASDDGQFVTVGGQSGQVWIWKIADGALLRKIPEDPK